MIEFLIGAGWGNLTKIVIRLLVAYLMRIGSGNLSETIIWNLYQYLIRTGFRNLLWGSLGPVNGNTGIAILDWSVQENYQLGKIREARQISTHVAPPSYFVQDCNRFVFFNYSLMARGSSPDSRSSRKLQRTNWQCQGMEWLLHLGLNLVRIDT